MKIGIVVDNELNNDIRVLREIAILRDQGYEIFVICYGFRKIYNSPLNQINITRINIRKKLKDILFFILNTIPFYEWMWAVRIKKFITTHNIEVLHVHDLYMARASHMGIGKAGKNIPLILDLHENYPFTVTTYNWTKGFFRNLLARPQTWQKKESKYLNYADRIIVLSNDYKYLLTNRYPELSSQVFTVLPNVPDLSEKFQQIRRLAENPFRNGSPVLFYYGVIAERRGIFDALEVFSNLINENYSLNFLFIGPVDKKDQSRFLNLIQSGPLSNNVRYIPWIDSGDLPGYLEIVDICVAPFHKNPQHESGVANKIYEYMLGAKPVIVSDCLPQQKLIEKHRCGLVFRDMKEFKNAIIKLIYDKELRTLMGSKGHEAVLNEYNTGITKENLILLYKNIGNL
jgi:glycosyltransferase involved in cell wall biosynthesis